MTGVLIAFLFGSLFGWVLIGPIAVTYSARQYFPLILFVCLVMGLAVVLANLIGDLIEGRPITRLMPVIGGEWIAFSFGVALATSLRVARR